MRSLSIERYIFDCAINIPEGLAIDHLGITICQARLGKPAGEVSISYVAVMGHLFTVCRGCRAGKGRLEICVVHFARRHDGFCR